MLIDAVIERRLLVNWRADPDAVRALLPDELEPDLVEGSAVVGICAVRLRAVRPLRLPAALGVTSESAAHRIGVRYDGQPAVYVARRDTSSRLSRLVGGRGFPGVHGPARFEVDDLRIRFRTPEGAVELDAADGPGRSALFATADEASRFFAAAPTGWSPGFDGRLEGVRLEPRGWSFEPVELRAARSWWFEERFPPGAIELDGAYVMREVPVTWRPVRPVR